MARSFAKSVLSISVVEGSPCMGKLQTKVLYYSRVHWSRDHLHHTLPPSPCLLHVYFILSSNFSQQRSAAVYAMRGEKAFLKNHDSFGNKNTSKTALTLLTLHVPVLWPFLTCNQMLCLICLIK